MYTILTKQQLAPDIYRMTIHAPRTARNARPGQFVMLRTDPSGERIPLTIVSPDPQAGTADIIFAAVGASTRTLAAMQPGDSLLDFHGPLGQPADMPTQGRVICVGGGVGTAVVYPEVVELHRRGVETHVIVGARTADLLILQDELAAHSTRLMVCTDDGSAGRKGLVTDQLRDLLEEGGYDQVIAIGPLIMMKFVCKLTDEYGIPTTVSLNPMMVDGTGMCGCCRVSVGGETKYACVDGPEFDGHLVDFDEAMARLNMYRTQEKEAALRNPCAEEGCKWQ